MLIRELTRSEKDYSQYITLINEFRTIGLHVSREKYFELYDIIFKNSIIFVLEIDNIIIASAKLLIDQKFIHQLSQYGHIEDVIIKKEYRGKKIGQTLIKYIVDYCKKKGFYKLTLTCNENLIPFYEKNDFRVYENHMSQLLKNNYNH